MTSKEAKRLLIGTVVTWGNDPDVLGTVRQLCDVAFFVDWADGQRGWIFNGDAKRISIR